jgi:hypothetical protein
LDEQSGLFPAFEGWQDSCGAFTYSLKEKDMIINYIKIKKNIIRRRHFMKNLKDFCRETELNLMKNVYYKRHSTPLGL